MAGGVSAEKAVAPLPMPPALGLRPVPSSRAALFVACAVPLLVAGVLAATREFLTFGTETDYLGGFVPEALRILHGEALLLEYHPPLYSFVVAAAWLWLDEWVAAGQLVSVLAAAATAGVGYALFRRVAGAWAGAGAALGLVASPVFVEYAALATSDVFFTLLYLGAFLLAVTALESGSRRLWLACGVAAGLALLTRTNGIAALAVLLAPALAAGTPRRKLADAALVALGVALPLAAWIAYALASGSRLAPALTHGALAQTYFAGAELRYAGPVRQVFEDRFGSVWEVLAYDPARMAQVYARDLLILARRLFGRDELIAFPLNHLALPGLLALLILRARAALWLLVGAAALHLLLLNFKPFEGRFYLYLAPFFGAGALVLMAQLLRLAAPGAQAAALRACIALAAAGAAAQAIVFTYPKLHAQDTLLGEVVQARGAVQPGASVLAMRPQVPFYLGATSLYVGRIDSLQHLAALLGASGISGPAYVYIGEDERRWWAFVGEMERREGRVAWLAPVAAGSGGGESWRLYEFKPQALRAAAPAGAGHGVKRR